LSRKLLSPGIPRGVAFRNASIQLLKVLPVPVMPSAIASNDITVWYTAIPASAQKAIQAAVSRSATTRTSVPTERSGYSFSMRQHYVGASHGPPAYGVKPGL